MAWEEKSGWMFAKLNLFLPQKLHSSTLDEKALDISFHNILQVRHKQNCLNTMLIIPRHQDECVILVKNVKHL